MFNKEGKIYLGNKLIKEGYWRNFLLEEFLIKSEILLPASISFSFPENLKIYEYMMEREVEI